MCICHVGIPFEINLNYLVILFTPHIHLYNNSQYARRQNRNLVFGNNFWTLLVLIQRLSTTLPSTTTHSLDREGKVLTDEGGLGGSGMEGGPDGGPVKEKREDRSDSFFFETSAHA